MKEEILELLCHSIRFRQCVDFGVLCFCGVVPGFTVSVFTPEGVI
jgi:hypothetical protein